MPREIEIILPTKVIRAFNEKTVKWGEKSVTYKVWGRGG